VSREAPVDALGIGRWPLDERPSPDLPVRVHVPESIHHMARRLNAARLSRPAQARTESTPRRTPKGRRPPP
jgi:hypothetical protein